MIDGNSPASGYEILSDQRGELLDALDIRHARRSATGQDVAIPTQYLVHRDGVVRWFYRDESIRLRPHPREALAAIRESVSTPLTKGHHDIPIHHERERSD